MSLCDLTYEQVVNTCECQDTLMHYSRYTRQFVGKEESAWVCDECEDVDVDPYEQDCSCYEPGVYDA